MLPRKLLQDFEAVCGEESRSKAVTWSKYPFDLESV